ncbi:hypothetical protein QUA70_12060 [Microcoleus sp. LAD1_D5]|uniref:hypothetical protein n=1 Tax=unclassified Microcoleus TaxID=2642155 RepID=UPI002FD38AFC
MESNNQSFQEVPPAIAAAAPTDSTNQDLNDLELDAIAGGRSDMADRALTAGMRVITTNSKGPNIGLVSLDLIEAASRAFGNRN